MTHVELYLGGIGCNLPGQLTLNCEQMTTLLQDFYEPCPTTHLAWCYVSMQQHLACCRMLQGANLSRIMYGVTLVQVVLCEAMSHAVTSAQHKQTTTECLRSPDKASLLCLCAPTVVTCIASPQAFLSLVAHQAEHVSPEIVSWCHQQQSVACEVHLGLES